MNVRVYMLAKEMELGNKTIMDQLERMSCHVANHMSIVSDDMVKALRKFYANDTNWEAAQTAERAEKEKMKPPRRKRRKTVRKKAVKKKKTVKKKKAVKKKVAKKKVRAKKKKPAAVAIAEEPETAHRPGGIRNRRPQLRQLTAGYAEDRLDQRPLLFVCHDLPLVDRPVLLQIHPRSGALVESDRHSHGPVYDSSPEHDAVAGSRRPGRVAPLETRGVFLARLIPDPQIPGGNRFRRCREQTGQVEQQQMLGHAPVVLAPSHEPQCDRRADQHRQQENGPDRQQPLPGGPLARRIAFRADRDDGTLQAVEKSRSKTVGEGRAQNAGGVSRRSRAPAERSRGVLAARHRCGRRERKAAGRATPRTRNVGVAAARAGYGTAHRFGTELEDFVSDQARDRSSPGSTDVPPILVAFESTDPVNTIPDSWAVNFICFAVRS